MGVAGTREDRGKEVAAHFAETFAVRPRASTKWNTDLSASSVTRCPAPSSFSTFVVFQTKFVDLMEEARHESGTGQLPGTATPPKAEIESPTRDILFS